MTVPDFADRIAARLLNKVIFDDPPLDIDWRSLLAEAAREGYALGLGVGS